MASWYERRILPHIVRCGCGSKMWEEYRSQIVPQARGRVLELGLGAGANLPYYDDAKLDELIGIEPSDELRAMARRVNLIGDFKVDFQSGTAEELIFGDASFDSVVCTYTLCTVADPDRALAEARRVLRPGGLFLFSEHGAAPDPAVARWQRRIDPLWGRVFGGCHVTRDMRGAIERHFQMEAYDARYHPGSSKLAGWMEWGRAVAV